MSSFRAAIAGLLRKAERITRTDNVYLVKNGGYLILTYAVRILNGFVLYLIIGHFLPQEIYGQYKYLLSLFGMFGIATFTGVETALGRAIATGAEGSLHVAFRRKLLGGAIGSLVTLGIAGYYALQGRGDLSAALGLLAIFAPFIYSGNVYGTFLTYKKRFQSYSRITVATSLISFVVMAVAFLTLRSPLALFGVFLLTGLTNLLAYAYARRQQANDKVDKDLIPYANHLSALDVFGTVANSLDGILIFHFLGAEALAVYSLAIVPVEQMKGALKAVQSVATPKFATASISTLKKTLRWKIFLFCLLITGLMGVYILLAPTFFALFFPRYLGSVAYSQIYSLSLIFSVPAALVMTLFQAKGMRKETTAFNIANYSIQILLLVLGSWLYGLWGTILARVLSRVLMFITTNILFSGMKETEEARG